jgi:glucose-1-phosphate cytidylyltransferase
MTLIAPRRRTAPVTTPRVAILASAAREKDSSPLTEIGGRPVLWHTMMQLATYGMQDFVIASNEPVTIASRHETLAEGWRVKNVRAADGLRALRDTVRRGQLLVTESAGLSDLDIDDLFSYHRSHGLLATVVGVRPAARFGRLEIEAGQVHDFAEKPAYEQGWVSAGICLLEPGAFDYLSESGEDSVQGTLAMLAQDGQLMAYKHDSFWGSLETLKDRQALEALWQSGNPPWKTWD